MKTIPKILDWLGKFFSRIQGVAFILVLCVLIMFGIGNGCQKKQAIQLAEQITGLSVKNGLLLAANQKLTASLESERVWRTVYENKSDVLEKTNIQLEATITNLQEKLKAVSGGLINITPDSSYKYLITSAYPFQGDLKYPFNEPQVRAIHKSYLENGLFVLLVDTMSLQVANCESRLGAKDTIISSYDKSLAMMGEENMNYKTYVSNSVEKENIYKKQIKKESRQITFYKVTTGIVVIVALVIAL